MINLTIISKPYNWFVVAFAALLLLFIAHLFFSPNPTPIIQGS